GRVLLRLSSVTLCPRAIAYSTCSGPVNPVPPRIRMFSDAFARSTGRGEEGRVSADTAEANPGSDSRPSAPAATAEAFRKVRRFGGTAPPGGKAADSRLVSQLGERARLSTARGPTGGVWIL